MGRGASAALTARLVRGEGFTVLIRTYLGICTLSPPAVIASYLGTDEAAINSSGVKA